MGHSLSEQIVKGQILVYVINKHFTK